MPSDYHATAWESGTKHIINILFTESTSKKDGTAWK